MNENQRQKLENFYVKKYPERQNLNISDIHEITDGWETKLHKYTINYVINDKHACDQHVIRIFSKDPALKSVKEYQVMQKLREQGYPVPVVFHNDTRGDIIGSPFITMEYLPGKTMDHRFNNVSDVEREKLYKQMIELFVELHRVSVTKVFPENEISDTRGYLSYVFKMIEDRINFLSSRARANLDWVYPVVKWLMVNANDVHLGEVSILHGDFHGKNIVYRDDGTPVVIDWNGAHVGDNRFDLAWTIILFSTFGGSFFRDLLLNLYSDISGNEIKDIEYFEALGCVLRIVHVFSSFLYMDEETGVVVKSDAWTPIVSEHFLKVYDMLVERTGIKLPEFEKILKN